MKKDMKSLPVTVDFNRSKFNDAKGDIGQSYIYGPVSITNHSDTNLSNLSLKVADFIVNDGSDWSNFFEVVEIPETFSLQAGESRILVVVYHPLKVTTDNIDNAAIEADFYVEDASGNTSETNQGHNILIFPEEERDIEQKFIKKWRREDDGDEFIYSYDLTLKNNEDIQVTDWFLFFRIKDEGFLDPDWLNSEKSWVREGDYKTSVSNTMLISAENTDHVINPQTETHLELRVVYKGENEAYEYLDNMGFNYVVTLSH